MHAIRAAHPIFYLITNNDSIEKLRYVDCGATVLTLNFTAKPIKLLKLKLMVFVNTAWRGTPFL